MDSTTFWSWSIHVCRLAGVEVRIHWSLLVLTAFKLAWAGFHGVPWWWLPVLLLIPFVSVLAHEFGHVTAARLCGGSADRIVMWMFGGLAFCQVPHTPGRQFFVSAAGPLTTFLIMAGCLLFLRTGLDFDADLHFRGGLLATTLAFTAAINISLLLFNLLPCYPLDGGSMLRSALWPLIGRARAVHVSLWIAYVVLTGLLAWALFAYSTPDWFLIALVVLIGVTVVREHRYVLQGFDPHTGEELHGGSDPDSALTRFFRRRAAARAEAAARREDEERALLDRLLAKVSEHGLPSLTESERRQLQAISRRQKDRAETASR